MLNAESSGRLLANVTPLNSGATATNSGGSAGEGRQAARPSVNARSLRKGRQYSVKTFIPLGAAALLFVTIGCREKSIDQGALITARTVGLDDLQRGRLADAEREFRKVIALAPRDPLGYANLGLTYLRAGRYGDAEPQLQRARRLDTANVDVALSLAKPHLDAAIEALRVRRLAVARTELDRFLRLMEVTAPYQAALAKVNWTEGPLVGRPVLAFNPASLITMRGIAPAANARVHFTDVTSESGLPDLGSAPTALVLGDYDNDGEDNLLIAWPPSNVRLYTLRRGFVADAGERIALPLPAGAVSATFADYDNDGWLDLFVIGTDGRGYLLHNREGRQFEDVTTAAHVRDVDGARRALFVDLDHDGDLDLLLVGGNSLAVYRNNLDGTFTLAPNADGIVQGGTDAAFGDVDDDGRTDVFVTSQVGRDGLFLNDAVRGFTRTADTIRGSGPVAIGDYDNDGALDLFVGGSEGGLWHNNGSGKFTRDTRSAAVLDRLRGASVGSVAFVDYENDGWLDLLVAGPQGMRLFHNDRGNRFEDATAVLPPAVQHDSS